MSTSDHKIDFIESTTDLMNGRAGLSAFSRYVVTVGVLNALEKEFGSLRKNSKGLTLRQFFHQTITWMADGTSRHINYFDELKQDESYAGVIEVSPDELASQDAIKRLFKAFRKGHEKKFRDILLEIFLARIRSEKPQIISLTLDSMVMDNDEAEVRHGVEPTYKGKKGFHPVQVIYNGMIIDGIFRNGKSGTHEFKKSKAMLCRIITAIREKYDKDVFIIVKLDSGYYDQRLVALLDELRVGFLLTGKNYESMREKVIKIPETSWKTLKNDDKQAWSFVEFEYKSDSWPKEYRAFYTQPHYDEKGEFMLEFARPSNVILTNITKDACFMKKLSIEDRREWLKPTKLILEHHKRGADELPHRGLKDFGFEQLPFKNYHANMAVYHVMLISFALFESFKHDVLFDVISPTSYATTVRRKFFDIAGKIVSHSKKIRLRLHEAVLERINFILVWERCCTATPLLL